MRSNPSSRGSRLKMKDSNIFECSLVPMREHECLDPKEDEKTKHGRYHGSIFPGVPMDRYVVAALIDGEYDGLSAAGLSDDDIVDGFISFLAQPKSKRSKKLKYGKLASFHGLDGHAICNKRSVDGKTILSVLFITSDPKNKNFWGKPRNMA